MVIEAIVIKNGEEERKAAEKSREDQEREDFRKDVSGLEKRIAEANVQG